MLLITLTGLSICCSRTFDVNPKKVSFDTPNLVLLEYSDTIADKYPKVEFSSLVEARLDLRMTKDRLVKAKFSDDDRSLPVEMVASATNFFMGICNVKVLHLSSDTLEVLTYCGKPIPEFYNLVHLTIQTDLEVSWGTLHAILKNCPKLETLVFEGLHYGDINHTPWEDTSAWLSSSPVKKLKVLKFEAVSCDIDDMDRQIYIIKHFVETMPNLEEVVLYYVTRGDDDDPRIVSTAFQMFEKLASTKCKIRVVSDKITLSSTIVCSTSATTGLL
ncbi:F-box/LRR-repeat protein At3g59210 [Brassica rapa]|uniref:F-box/LRR-repeat protein At3g59210 n=1 Tax=Brassica campestris TaxID=3711 RepID=UPI0004F1A121|nr:F-box/LRR-repeat protein At3g59210 [Brassica rapa]